MKLTVQSALPRRSVGLVSLILIASLGACTGSDSIGAGHGGNNGAGNNGGTNPGSGGTGNPPNSKPPMVTPMIPVPGNGMPGMETTTSLPLPAAAPLGEVKYVPNRSSVRLYLPGVQGARDYRVFAVDDKVSVAMMGGNRERINGATIHCAGLRQRNQCDDGEILPIKYNNEFLDMPLCENHNIDRRPNVPTQLMQTLEVNGIGPDTTLVVEAIDRQCPFPGLFGSRHEDSRIIGVEWPSNTAQATINNKAYTMQLFPKTFPLRTEAEIRNDYGSMILNGQGPNLPVMDPSAPGFPESPYIRVGQPAPADDPVVLARAVVKVSTMGAGTLPPGFGPQDYFDDFDDPNDKVTLLRKTDYIKDVTGFGSVVNVYTTKKWVLYDVGNQLSDFLVDRGQMVMIQGDTAQDSMTLQAMYPRRPVHLPDAPDHYLHVTYEAQRNETDRRYENLVLCGSDQVGQTYEGDVLKAAPLPHPGFMNEMDTTRTSVLGWNCLYLVGRGPGYGVLPGGDINSHSDTSLKITVIASHPANVKIQEYDSTKITKFASSFGPNQNPPKLYQRQIDASGQPSGMWLDDQTHAWQRARFDVFIRRDRLVIYVEGQQRICQDLPPNSLTMAEGALGFWHVLYHSSAEFLEMRRGLDSDNPRTGQHHIMHNTPFADERSWDNVGFREDVAVPENFDAARCLKAN